MSSSRASTISAIRFTARRRESVADEVSRETRAMESRRSAPRLTAPILTVNARYGIGARTGRPPPRCATPARQRDRDRNGHRPLLFRSPDCARPVVRWLQSAAAQSLFRRRQRISSSRRLAPWRCRPGSCWIMTFAPILLRQRLELVHRRQCLLAAGVEARDRPLLPRDRRMIEIAGQQHGPLLSLTSRPDGPACGRAVKSDDAAVAEYVGVALAKRHWLAGTAPGPNGSSLPSSLSKSRLPITSSRLVNSRA